MGAMPYARRWLGEPWVQCHGWGNNKSETTSNGTHRCGVVMLTHMQCIRAQWLMCRELWAQCHDVLLHQEEGIGKAWNCSGNETDARAYYLNTNAVWMCQLKKNKHAREPLIYIHATTTWRVGLRVGLMQVKHENEIWCPS